MKGHRPQGRNPIAFAGSVAVLNEPTPLPVRQRIRYVHSPADAASSRRLRALNVPLEALPQAVATRGTGTQAQSPLQAGTRDAAALLCPVRGSQIEQGSAKAR